MKKFIILLFIPFLLATIKLGECAAPDRQNDYITGELITAADVTANEDEIFDYLQAGVEVIAADSVDDTDIDWGTGTDQVSQDDVVDGSTYKQYNPASVTITGGSIVGITDIVVGDGGTGASSFTDGGILLGSGTSPITAMSVLSDGAIVVGDGTGDPVALSAFSSSTGTLNVNVGGTGVGTLTDGGVLFGSGTGAITASSVLTNGQLLIGDNSTDPALATLSDGEGIDITNAAGSITILGEDATSANKGIAKFNTDNFLVSSGDVTIKNDGVILSTETIGDFVNSITAGTNISSTGATSGENISHTFSVDDAFIINSGDDSTSGSVSMVNCIASNTVTGIVVDTQYLEYSSGGDVTVRDGLTVNGTVTADYYSGDGSALTNIGVSAATGLTISAKVNEAGGIKIGQPVYISGATGQFPQVSLCDNTDVDKKDFTGIAAQTKSNNQTILVRVSGELTGVDADGDGDLTSSDEAWTNGQELYMSATGYLTDTIPTSGIVLHAAHVSYNHGVTGKLIITEHAIPRYIAVASGQTIEIRMGDSSGSTKVSFEDYSDSEVASIDSDGRLDIINVVASDTVTGLVVSFEGGTFDTYFYAGTPTESVYYRLPLTDGAPNQVIKTDGYANLYFSADEGGVGSFAPVDATYITQTSNSDLSAEQVLGSLSSGIMRVNTTDGVITSLTDSAGLFANLSDETGSGSGSPLAVFNQNPTITTINLTGGQIAFPASPSPSGDANTLDEYEEGYHVATIACGTGGSYGLDGASDTLAYTKIGRTVHLVGDLHITSEGSPNGQLQISVPFVPTDLTEGADVSYTTFIIRNHGDAGLGNPVMLILYGYSFLALNNLNDDGSTTTIDETKVDTDFSIYVNITYNVE